MPFLKPIKKKFTHTRSLDSAIIYFRKKSVSSSAKKQAQVIIPSNQYENFSPYQIGEDAKHIDWKITAKTLVPYTRKSFKNTPFQITFLIDASSSILYKNKQFVIAEILAQFCLSAQREKIPIAALFFSQEDAFYFKHRVQDSLFLAKQFLSWDLLNKKSSFSKLEEKIKSLPLKKRREEFILLSDFLDLPFQSRIAKQKYLAIQIYHPDERKLPLWKKNICFECLETKEKINIVPKKISVSYEKNAEAEYKKLKKSFSEQRMPFISISSKENTHLKLHQFFSTL